MLFWLVLLGLMTYFIVERSVSGITRTPVWMLWLVMMTPAFLWTGWTLLYGPNRPMPQGLVVGPFLVCFPLYWLLIQWGRRDDFPANSRPATPTPATPQTQLPKSLPTPQPLNKTEESQLQSCFPWTVYYLQSIEYRPQAVICRGHLRSQPDEAYERVRSNIQQHFGDRFFVVFQEGTAGKPFFALVPNAQAQASNPSQNPIYRPGLAVGLLLATLLTTILVGTTQIAGISAASLQANPALWLQGLSYSLALMVILGVHEAAHYATARFYQVQTTLPYFIPVPFFLGTFGAFIQMRSPIPHRKALFDIAIAGPLAGFLITLPILLWGLAHSTLVPLPADSHLLDLDPFNPRSSLLVLLLGKLALGNALTLETALKLHPVAIAGCLGLIVTALNLMPVGQLDGGHIVHAIFGQRAGAAIGQVARLVVLVLSVIQPQLFVWALLLFLMPILDEPALNDVSELDNRRDLAGLLSLGILLLIILPAPTLLARLVL